MSANTKFPRSSMLCSHSSLTCGTQARMLTQTRNESSVSLAIVILSVSPTVLRIDFSLVLGLQKLSFKFVPANLTVPTITRQNAEAVHPRRVWTLRFVFLFRLSCDSG